MVSFEMMALVSFINFLIGASIIIWNNKVTKLAYCFSTVGIVIVAWLAVATFTYHPVVDITYHTIDKQVDDDGKFFDMIKVKDQSGEEKVVNVNKIFGLSFKEEQKEYKVARIGFSGTAFGIYFKKPPKYRLLEKN